VIDPRRAKQYNIEYKYIIINYSAACEDENRRECKRFALNYLKFGFAGGYVRELDYRSTQNWRVATQTKVSCLYNHNIII